MNECASKETGNKPVSEANFKFDSAAIHYCLVIEDDDAIRTMPLQGYSEGLLDLTWAFRIIAKLPSDIFEPALADKAVLARRIAGVGNWRAFPLPLRELQHVKIHPRTPFWVVFSGSEVTSRAVDAWAEASQLPPLHVSNQGLPGTILPENISLNKIASHIISILEIIEKGWPTFDVSEVRSVLSNWKERNDIAFEGSLYGHLTTLPNYMVLGAAGYRIEEVDPFIGKSEQEYRGIILETADKVIELRNSIPIVPGFRIRPPQPSILLSVPAMHRHLYRRIRLQQPNAENKDVRATQEALRLFQTQTGFRSEAKSSTLRKVLESDSAKSLLSIWQQELGLYASVVGLRCASTLAASIRLPPKVNRTFNQVEELTSHIRSKRNIAEKKVPKLFGKIQAELKDAVGEDFMSRIEEMNGSIKIVSDAPLEWLPVKDLPLGIRNEVSRIPSTPGNLMLSAVIQPSLLTLSQEDLRRVLIISGFDSTDPLRNIVSDALEVTAHNWRDKVNIQSIKATTRQQFVDALNQFEGSILIFDGHGHHNEFDDLGALQIGKEEVNVWELRNEIRVPPIVILSACDTQAVAKSHVTTANGFLVLGARAVLGTLLPIEAKKAGAFIARLMHRIAEYVPMILEARQSAVTWSEIVTGMLRMQLLSELLYPLMEKRLISVSELKSLQTAGNIDINTGRSEWYVNLIDRVQSTTGLEVDFIRRDFGTNIAVSQSVRYVHLGNPESIVINDPAISETKGIEY